MYLLQFTIFHSSVHMIPLHLRSQTKVDSSEGYFGQSKSLNNALYLQTITS